MEPEQPDVVYHYTSMEGLLGIIAERAIRATAIEYLNDVKEHCLLLDAVKSQLPFVTSNYEGITGESLEQVGRSLRPGLPSLLFRPFVASFSRHRDALVQWRAYCPEGNGISVGFKLSHLEAGYVTQPKPNPTSRVVPMRAPVEARFVTYVENAYDLKVLETIHESYGDSLKWMRDYAPHLPGENYSVDSCFANNIDWHACYFKHKAFEHEKEYRIAVRAYPMFLDKMEFRTKRSVLIPYVSIHIPRVGQIGQPGNWDDESVHAGEWGAISSITVGPTPNMSLSTSAVSALLASRGIQANVEPSEIPYREW